MHIVGFVVKNIPPFKIYVTYIPYIHEILCTFSLITDLGRMASVDSSRFLDIANLKLDEDLSVKKSKVSAHISNQFCVT